MPTYTMSTVSSLLRSLGGGLGGGGGCLFQGRRKEGKEKGIALSDSTMLHKEPAWLGCLVGRRRLRRWQIMTRPYTLQREDPKEFGALPPGPPLTPSSQGGGLLVIFCLILYNSYMLTDHGTPNPFTPREVGEARGHSWNLCPLGRQ